MKCRRCEHENPVGVKFCGECGARLEWLCPVCRASNPPANKFCHECGVPLTGDGGAAKLSSPHAHIPKHLAEKILNSKSALEGERKQVTVLFADLKGSMELLADRDPEEARKLLDPVLERMMEAVHRYEGTVNQVMGDGIMALFGAPIAHEDHAVRACFAALRMQEAVKRYAEEIQRSHGVPVQIRVGLNSGEVVVRSIGSDLRMDYTAVGQTTHLAARMEQMAVPGSILISPDTMALADGYLQVKPLGPILVKGLSEPMEGYEILGAGPVRSRMEAAMARGLTRFVGREAEIEALCRALEQARSGHGQVVALVGEAGVGKSRLFREVLPSQRMHGWLVVEGGSASYGKGTPYLPLIDLLKNYCQIEARDDGRRIREKLTGRILALEQALAPTLPAFLALLDVPVEDRQWGALDPPQRRQRTLEALKRLLLRESQIQPVCLALEDLHWIDSETQAFLDSLIESLPTLRVLCLVNYRPEYQHGWGSKSYYTQLRIDPLPPASAEELLRALLGDDPGVEPLKRLLIARTQGNPFFLEESVRTLVETQVLIGERGAYHLAKALPDIQVPATVQAILAARIDRLPPEEKRLLQAASVIGEEVPFALLQAVSEGPEEALRQGLAHLQAAEFLYEARLFPDLEYTFKHGLTYQVAYRSLLHERRRALHRQVGEALERFFPDRTEEMYSRLAHHFVECGEMAKGLNYSSRAAERAVALFAHDEALGHYERARACAEALNLPEQLAAIEEAIGHIEHRRGLFQRAIESYQCALGRALTREKAAVLKFRIGRVCAQVGDQRGLEFLRAALEELNPVTQPNELAQATAMVGRYHHYAAQHSEAIEFLERARQLAEPSDDAETLASIYAPLAGAYQHMGLFDKSMEWARQCIALGERKKYPIAVATGYEFLSEGFDPLGKWDDALASTTRAWQIAERIGAQHSLAWAEYNRAKAFYGKGDLAAAAAAATAGLTLAGAIGDRRLGVLARAMLSQIRTDLGEDEAARTDAEVAVAGAEEFRDRYIRCCSRHALAYFHLQREEWEPAAELFDQSAQLLEGTDHRKARLSSGADAAEVALGQGRVDQAEKMIAKSVELARDARSRHYEAVALRVRGQILSSQNLWDGAAHAFDEAIDILEQQGSRHGLGRALYHRGIMRQTQGEMKSARRDLARACAIFVDIGASRDRERAERGLRLFSGPESNVQSDRITDKGTQGPAHA
jgi:class 3 adenylate cyclase/tetratricopeptide (TPR) repeat protein